MQTFFIHICCTRFLVARNISWEKLIAYVGESEVQRCKTLIWERERTRLYALLWRSCYKSHERTLHEWTQYIFLQNEGLVQTHSLTSSHLSPGNFVTFPMFVYTCTGRRINFACSQNRSYFGLNSRLYTCNTDQTPLRLNSTIYK